MSEDCELAAHSKEHKEVVEEQAVEWTGGDRLLLVVALLLALRSGSTSMDVFCNAHGNILELLACIIGLGDVGLL